MASATTQGNKKTANEMVKSNDFDKTCVKFTPLAESKPIEVSVAMVKRMLAVRSKSGREPGNGDVWKFLQLCKARSLNPFVNDCYLIGYDSKEGKPGHEVWVTKWSLITAIQAFRKRAEVNPNYEGCECGVIVRVDDVLTERQGTVVIKGETLVGGWAKVYRKDRRVPEYRTVELATYNSGKSRWAKDPGGMIVKCAEAAGLRAAFPSDLASLYVAEEFDRVIDAEASPVREASKDLGEVTKRIAADGPTVEQTEQLPDDSFDGVDPPHSEDDAIQAPPEETKQAEKLPENPASESPEERREREAQEKAQQPARGAKQKQKDLMPTHENTGK